MREHDVPIWNGEFGPVYSNLKESEDWETINEERANMVGHQLEIYSREHVSWSIWCYKVSVLFVAHG
jgi:hypothetical protein